MNMNTKRNQKPHFFSDCIGGKKVDQTHGIEGRSAPLSVFSTVWFQVITMKKPCLKNNQKNLSCILSKFATVLNPECEKILVWSEIYQKRTTGKTQSDMCWPRTPKMPCPKAHLQKTQDKEVQCRVRNFTTAAMVTRFGSECLEVRPLGLKKTPCLPIFQTKDLLKWEVLLGFTVTILPSLLRCLWKRRQVVLELQWFHEYRDLWFTPPGHQPSNDQSQPLPRDIPPPLMCHPQWNVQLPPPDAHPHWHATPTPPTL